MKTSAAVVVVGAGVMGTSAAYHLAARGWRDVLVLDRAPGPGAGSTGAATGGFRAQFGSAVNVRLSILSREKLRAFAAETGMDPGYEAAGYLWLAESQDELAALRAGLAVQHAEGLHEAEEVGADTAARLNPALRVDGLIGGAFCPTDGFLRPLGMLEGYLAAALRLGVAFEWGVQVVGLDRSQNGRIVAVKTSGRTVATGAVVNAAGPWAAAVAAMAGVAVPVEPLRRQMAVTVPCDLLPTGMPMTLFAGSGFHLRVRDGRVLLLRPSPGVPGLPFDTRVDPDWIDSVQAEARRKVPALCGVPIDREACRAGLYEMSPDRHALLGPAVGCENLFLINGSSGHGVMHCPALGVLLAEILSDGVASSLDVTALRPSRFVEGRPNPASEIL